MEYSYLNASFLTVCVHISRKTYNIHFSTIFNPTDNLFSFFQTQKFICYRFYKPHGDCKLSKMD